MTPETLLKSMTEEEKLQHSSLETLLGSMKEKEELQPSLLKLLELLIGTFREQQEFIIQQQEFIIQQQEIIDSIKKEREAEKQILLKVKLLSEKAKIPQSAYEGDTGLDLFSTSEAFIQPGESALISTGISIQLPPETEAQIRPRSGLALKHQVTVLNTPGTIDQGYRGEIGVILINHGKLPFKVEVGMKIAQMVIKPILSVQVNKVEELDETDRGVGGFGSTGI
jgi:dUTP pyrophosphatase